jgi:hypothetical protein
MNKTVAIGLLSLGIAAGAGATQARAAGSDNESTSSQVQPGDQPGKTMAREIHTTASVTAIDHGKRKVTLKKSDGEETTIDVPQEVKSFDQLKVGDQVDVDYYESMAVSMMPPGTKASTTTRSGSSMQLGMGVTGKETSVTAEVVSVDPDKNTVSLKGPKGNMKTITVSDPEMQRRLPNVKPGQMYKFTYTEATAVSLEPKGK